MALVNVTVDTVDKTFVVTIDGVVLDKVKRIHIYEYEDYQDNDVISCEISTHEKDEENKLHKTVTYYTAGSKEAKSISKSDANLSLNGFIGIEDNKVDSHIDKFFDAFTRRS